MPQVIFIDNNGEFLQEVSASVGTSIMQVAVDNGIDGILAECGGTCSCATCHCYIGERWMAAAGQPGEMETELLTCVIAPAANSRLACQVFLTDELDGVEIRVPVDQM